jgi:hypothetical protein
MSCSSGNPLIFQLQPYSDADWGGNIHDKTSTSALIIYLGSNLISGLSKQQKAVARLSIEAEYMYVANAADEVMWLLNLLGKLWHEVSNSSTLL